MYCRFLTHALAEFDQTTANAATQQGKTTIQETERQHKTEEEKLTSFPTPPNKRGKKKVR
jgi:hypothetical protein